MAMTASLEDYLKIAGLVADRGELRLTDIAARLGVSKPSALAALKKLEELGLVEHKRYRRFKLTKEGIRRSAEIGERYSTLTAFLLNIVGVTATTAEKDACKMEHIFSSETYKKIKAMVPSR
ncbi:MAG: metal-dependent transcriptional regulator [Spirochaetaceae bacterium]|jgi:DtxR family Mn-dependent transcriptional regulator|nr:metal-dependent transcriptional regulator [Spirochaetaceae bacterium]